MVREALLDAETSGMTLALIAGDLNLEAAQLGCGPTLALAGWTDVGHGHPTSAASSLRPRRIDHLLANRQLLQRITHYDINWASGMPTHAQQTITLLS